MASSSLAVAEALVHMFGLSYLKIAADIGVLGVSAVQAWKFRPWKAGKQTNPNSDSQKHQHKHHDHGHDHDDCGHAHLVSPEMVDRSASALKRLGGLALAAATRAMPPKDKRRVRHAAGGWLQRARYAPKHLQPTQSWANRMAYRPRHASKRISLPPKHPWTYHPRNYKRDVLQRVQSRGEPFGAWPCARATGYLLIGQFMPRVRL